MIPELNDPPIPVLPSYRLEKEFVANFENGKHPGWVSTETRGDATITFESAEGGRATINTTTGGWGRLELPSMDPANFDGVALTIVTKGPGDKSLALNETAMYATGSDYAVVKRQEDRFITNVDGVKWTYDIHAKDWSTRPVRQTLAWDIKNDRMWCLTGGMVSEVVTNPLDTTIGSYTIEPFKIATQDTSGPREGYCYHLSVQYYNR